MDSEKGLGWDSLIGEHLPETGSPNFSVQMIILEKSWPAEMLLKLKVCADCESSVATMYLWSSS